jgi:ParB family chromosome partitioning protein
MMGIFYTQFFSCYYICMSELFTNSIFFIDVDKIAPNPYQTRKEFEEAPLRDLSESIRQYGVLQPLVVSRIEIATPEGGLTTTYELIAGERRLRASKLAGLAQVPAIIRVGDDSLMKLELAIIENLQREDINAVERARAFARLVEEFKLTHTQIGQKVGKSREYVSNSIRLLALSEEILDALSGGRINEGHTRPLMMLASRPEEQMTLFKEIVIRKISVREAERIARRIAVDKVRKKQLIPNTELLQIEQKLQESLGTRVHIEPREQGGKITIDYFTPEDLEGIMNVIEQKTPTDTLHEVVVSVAQPVSAQEVIPEDHKDAMVMLDDRDKEEIVKSEEDIDDLYNIKNFSL